MEKLRREVADLRIMIEEIHAAVVGGADLKTRKPGTLAIKLAARRMLEASRQPRPALKAVSGGRRRVS